MDHEIVIHAWADIACPWCWIGKKRLDEGIELSGKKVAVEYHSYQLRPDAPSSSHESLTHHLADAYSNTIADVEEQLANLTRLGTDLGISFDWNGVQSVNTFLAHQLVYAAKESASTPEERAVRGIEMFERLWEAYFMRGLNVADSDTLIDIASEADLDTDLINTELQCGDHADAVRSDIRDAKMLEITGVPFYVVGGKFGISGAQPPEIFSEAITKAVSEMQATVC
ncbi:DsbA family oxidoreductase [Arcanobacterium ihumii]|uniref:DsbA family oxidoreductase n=1 Tax=Arcanobacterium ihumii TaxID=2138162 RepID=UPI001357D2CD|nr:DsbA family oxidoreductase [Arcanobacterium ihumii]